MMVQVMHRLRTKGNLKLTEEIILGSGFFGYLNAVCLLQIPVKSVFMKMAPQYASYVIYDIFPVMEMSMGHVDEFRFEWTASITEAHFQSLLCNLSRKSFALTGRSFE